MSEEISSGAAIETANNNNNNNNNNNTKKLPKQNSENNSSDYDEMGEEFSFSDSDLDEEFEDCDSNARSNNADNDDDDDDVGLMAATTTTTTTEATSIATSTKHLDSTQNTLCDDESTKLLPVQNTSIPDDVIVENVSKTKKPKSVNEKSNAELLPAAIETTVEAQTNNKNHVDDDDDDDDHEIDKDDDYYSDEPEDELIVQFLGEANRIAEARLTARRLARTEAREIRMRELERQQKEQEQNGDRVFDKHNSPALESITHTRRGTINSITSRRSSEDSLDEEGRGYRDIKQELKDAEERFRKAMIANAQMDNERASQAYQIEHLKDQLEELNESHMQVQRELKDKTRDCNALQRNVDKLNEELKLVHGQLNERDALIAEQGLVVVAVENEDGSDAKRTLITAENAQLLGSVQGSLDVRLKRFNEEKQNLREEIEHLRTQLEHYKSKDIEAANRGRQLSEEEFEAQREANKLLCDYKFRLQKAEQDIASLQANLARSETQLIRYKSAAEVAEKAEAELKGDRRKLQKENREALERLEELETSNKHLLKRLDKLKNAKSALLKEI